MFDALLTWDQVELVFGPGWTAWGPQTAIATGTPAPARAPGVDIAMLWMQPSVRGDMVASAPGLLTGRELETALLVSLFSDRLAAENDDAPDNTGDRRGWWADGDTPIGSRLWLLARAKQTNETLQRAYDFVAESLQWLIDDGVVQSFDISVTWVRAGFLGVQITTYQPNATTRYGWVWGSLQ